MIRMKKLFVGQGATEYLVLLAVVLIIALVGIALLGFFPGTASDAQLRESEIYWDSASPIAVIETGAVYQTDNYTVGYLRLRNTGSYSITITKVLGNGGTSATQIYNGSTYAALQSYYAMAPGEEKYFGHNPYFSVPANYGLFFSKSLATPGTVSGAASVCEAVGRGNLVMQNFGFEYIQNVEGQQITKRQVGTKPLMVKCA